MLKYLTTSNTLKKYQLWVNTNTLFSSSIIIRGIGYRVFLLENDLLNTNAIATIKTSYINSIKKDCIEFETAAIELINTRYLIIRAGHTTDLYIPLKPSIFIKTAKKERKITIYGKNKQEVQDLVLKIYNYRRPSAYTGRGIRLKHIKPIRKVGKKDKQKGKSF